MLMENVVKGEYKGKSKPIAYRDFARCWIDIQCELDNIFHKNQKLGKNMSEDQRVNYDLAIVVSSYPKWKKKQEFNKQKIENRKVAEQKEVKVNYSKIKTIDTDNGLGDISDLLDEI